MRGQYGFQDVVKFCKQLQLSTPELGVHYYPLVHIGSTVVVWSVCRLFIRLFVLSDSLLGGSVFIALQLVHR